MTLVVSPAYKKSTFPFSDDDLEMDDYKEVERFTEYNDDPLVLSCAQWRLAKEEKILAKANPNHPIVFANGTLTMNRYDLVKEVLPIDRELATAIRLDFQGKLVYLTLTMGKLSRFKTDLHTFLNTNFKQSDNNYVMSDKFAGMVHKLPYFHEYNNAQLALFEDAPKQVKGDQKHDGTVAVRFITKLNPKSTRMGNKEEYWFEDENKVRYVVEIERTNSLLGIFEFVKDHPLKLTGNFNKRSNYTVQYYVASRWALNI